MGGGGSGSIDNIDSSEIGVLFVLHQIALYIWDLHYEFVFIRECQIKSSQNFLTDLTATRTSGMWLTKYIQLYVRFNPYIGCAL